jgi:hypothetical protein
MLCVGTLPPRLSRPDALRWIAGSHALRKNPPPRWLPYSAREAPTRLVPMLCVGTSS